MNLSIIIPSYNGLSKLQQHLPSILQAAENGDELIIGDDASTDQTLTWLRSEFGLVETKSAPNQSVPDRYQLKQTKLHLFQGNYFNQNKKITIKVLRAETNLRYAAMVNVCVTFCHFDFFFLANNDVSCEEKSLTQLKLNLKTPNLFAVGCLEYPNPTSNQKSGKNKLWFEKGIFQHSKAEDFISGETAWVSGGSGVFSTQKWILLNGFDLLFYPAYWEDIDICFRAKAKGWQVLFEAQAIVYHHHESTNEDVFGQRKIAQISWKNAVAFTWKNGNLRQRVAFLLWYPYWQVQRWRAKLG